MTQKIFTGEVLNSLKPTSREVSQGPYGLKDFLSGISTQENAIEWSEIILPKSLIETGSNTHECKWTLRIEGITHNEVHLTAKCYCGKVLKKDAIEGILNMYTTIIGGMNK
jgi:hypothetical protein